jgi:predicted DNA-binding transcriptional regulator YafY
VKRHPGIPDAILSRLAAGTVKAGDVAAALGVSIRTVYRHVDRLRAAGHRIEGQAGVGFMLRPNRAAGHIHDSI